MHPNTFVNRTLFTSQAHLSMETHILSLYEKEYTALKNRRYIMIHSQLLTLMAGVLVLWAEYHLPTARAVSPELALGIVANMEKQQAVVRKRGFKSNAVSTTISTEFEPAVQGTYRGNIVGCDCAVGFDAISSRSINMFGHLKRTVAGAWKLTGRMDTKVATTQTDDWYPVGVLLQAEGPFGTLLRTLGTVDPLANRRKTAIAMTVTDVSVEQPFPLFGGHAVVSSRYDLVTKRPDFVVSYGTADTCVTVAGDRAAQSVTIRQRIDDNREIAPTVRTDGSVEFEYCRHNFWGKSGGTMTAVYKPDHSVMLGYKDQRWSAKAVIPVDGYMNPVGGAKITLMRSIEKF